ncbi:3'-5' exoribonuclease YhaM family protein [Isobaculum melis]|uniref:3'-5' exoribonuclease n=1 Tax=Isobaculum melis TaxID=142588 RepID=A0A1H9QK18_9LACT|nr:HD domain-containing protein [Isobaculum melis]SER60737.1 3'-5' exoribonuclease [Isobaculum melis]
MEKKIFEYNKDENFDLYLLIKNADIRIAKNGKKFIAFTFQDTSGQIDGKYWDASEEDTQQFLAGKVVRIGGKRELYQGNPQVKIFHIRLAKENEPSNPELYLERAPLSKEEMVEEINQTLFDIDNANIQRVVRYLLTQYHQEFFQHPAAKKNHHAYAGGLSHHTISMLRLAKAICELHPELDKALLYAGVILHDLGKVFELSGALATEYTLVGNLVGHIVIVDEEITKACLALKIDDKTEDILTLKHLVLSHHGQLDYGSPVRPRIREAEVLHQIDNLDASINMMNDVLSRTESGSFSERVFGLDNRSFYKPTMSE